MSEANKQHPAPPAPFPFLPLGELLAQLKREGFQLGVDTHIALQRLLAQFDPQTELETLRDLLCPLLAGNEKQQRRFDEIFKQLTRPEASPEKQQTEQQAKNAPAPIMAVLKEHQRRFLMALVALLLVIGATVALWDTIRDLTVPTVTPGESNQTIQKSLSQDSTATDSTTNLSRRPPSPGATDSSLTPADLTLIDLDDPLCPREVIPAAWENWVEAGRWGLLIYGLTALVLLELYLRRHGQLAVTYRKGRKPPFVWPINFPETPLQLSGQFYRTAWQYRRRRLGQDARLDIPGTVKATVRKAGAVHLVYRPATRPAEYLVLIDQSHPQNHQSRLFEWVAQSLLKHDVYLERFYYDGDPRVCWNERHPEGLPLEALQRQYPDYRVILFGSGAGLIDPYSGRLGEWAERFGRWEERVVFTPRPSEFWNARELRLAELFLVLPATAAGMAELIGQLGRSDRRELAFYIEEAEHYDPGIDLAAPPEEVIRQMRRAFRPGGGDAATPDLLSWIAACAIYPELFWDLTLFIGETLSTPENPLLTQDNLLRLSRLAWFQGGRMPEEFRRRLLFDETILPPTQRHKVAAALGKLLKQNLPNDPNTLAYDRRRMHIVVSELLLDRRGRQQRRLLRELAQLQAATGEDDHVALTLLEGPKDPLAYTPPPDLTARFPSRAAVWGWPLLRGVAVTAAVVAGFFLLPRCFEQPVAQILGERQGAPMAVAFSPDGRTLASAYRDHTVRLWSVETREEIARLEGHDDGVLSVAFSPDGKTLASGSEDNTIRIWDIEQRAQIATLEGHTRYVSIVAFSPDGKTLASGSGDNTIRIWDIEQRAQIATLEGHTSDVLSVAFSPDGKTLASGSYDNTIRIWDIEQRAQIATLEGHTRYVLSVAFSPDGKTLASGSYDNTIRIWDIEQRAQIATLEGHTSYVRSVAFSPDGKTLASGSYDNTIRIWDIEQRAQIATLEGHRDQVYAVAFSPNDSLIASGGWDTAIMLWQRANFARASERYARQAAATRFTGEQFRKIPGGVYRLPADSSAGVEAMNDSLSPFQIGAFEVTQRQWEAIMGDNPSRFPGPDRPVENASAETVQNFLQRLNAFSEDASYRLPTVAEWRYAAAAGQSITFDSTALDSLAWFAGNAGGQTHRMGLKSANSWGLHDMLGNVAELCQEQRPPDSAADSLAASRLRLMGGSWRTADSSLTGLFQEGARFRYRSNSAGFRLVRVPREWSWGERVEELTGHPGWWMLLSALVLLFGYWVATKPHDRITRGKYRRYVHWFSNIRAFYWIISLFLLVLWSGKRFIVWMMSFLPGTTILDVGENLTAIQYYRTCNKCQRDNPKNAVRCNDCGNWFEKFDKDEHQTLDITFFYRWLCPKCQRMNVYENKVCECGFIRLPALFIKGISKPVRSAVKAIFSVVVILGAIFFLVNDLFPPGSHSEPIIPPENPIPYYPVSISGRLSRLISSVDTLDVNNSQSLAFKALLLSFQDGVLSYARGDYVEAIRQFHQSSTEAEQLRSRQGIDLLYIELLRDWYFYLGLSLLHVSFDPSLPSNSAKGYIEEGIQELILAKNISIEHQLSRTDRDRYFLALGYELAGNIVQAMSEMNAIPANSEFYPDSRKLLRKYDKN